MDGCHRCDKEDTVVATSAIATFAICYRSLGSTGKEAYFAVLLSHKTNYHIIIISMASTRILLLHQRAAPRTALALRRSWKEASNTTVTLSRPFFGAVQQRYTTTTTTDEEKESPSTNKQQPSSTAKAYADLAKARLSGLVVATTACGFLAAGGPFSAPILGSCVVGTALCSSSAAAWNQILEIDRDARMKRTQQRPLVQGILSVPQAQRAATLWGVGGVGLLYAGTDPTTTLLGLSNMALYAGLYTWMKPRSIYNTWVGALVGAIPPVMGWTAATGGSLLDVEALLLGSTLYLWQMPHFFALSFMYRDDYGRGGFAMVPVLEANNPNNTFDHTAQLITRYAAYLSTIPFLATFTGVTSSMFALEGIVLNAYAFHVAHKFSRDRTNANARKVFLTSLWYLPSFMVLFLLHSRVWDEEENKEKDAVREWIAARVHNVREVGRQVCIHEKAIHHHSDKDQDTSLLLEASKQACPVALGSQKSREGVEALKRRATEAAKVVAATQEASSSSSSS